MSGKEQKKSLFLKLFIGSFFCLLVGLAYLLFFSPVFRFQQISVDLDKLNQPLVEQARDLVDSRLQANNWWQLPTKSFFAFNAGQLKQDLQAQFPELGEIKIYKRLFWPQGFKWQPGLYVEISLRQKQVLYCQAGTILEPDNFNYDLDVGQCYWLDEQGIIFAKTPLIKGGSVILA